MLLMMRFNGYPGGTLSWPLKRVDEIQLLWAADGSLSSTSTVDRRWSRLELRRFGDETGVRGSTGRSIAKPTLGCVPGSPPLLCSYMMEKFCLAKEK